MHADPLATIPVRSDDKTFGTALAAQNGRLMIRARQLCKSATEAEDLVQQTLLKGWAYRGSFLPGTNLGAWLKTILRNEFVTESRRLGRRPTRAYVPEADDPICLPNQEWAASLEELRGKLGQLGRDQAQALIMVGALGYGHDEAAALSGCAEGTMKSRVSRARASLRHALEPVPAHAGA